jgi:hypothetical protein
MKVRGATGVLESARGNRRPRPANLATLAGMVKARESDPDAAAKVRAGNDRAIGPLVTRDCGFAPITRYSGTTVQKHPPCQPLPSRSA